MKKIVVSKEVAQQEFGDLCEYWEIDTSDNEVLRTKFIGAITRGRLSFNKDTDEFKYILRKPITLENKETISELTLKEIDTQALTAASKDNDFIAALKMISSSSGVPYGVIERMSPKDTGVLGAILAFFV